jgi:hypothetical protein
MWVRAAYVKSEGDFDKTRLLLQKELQIFKEEEEIINIP